MALFLFAHPDDEFGVFAEIEFAIARGERPVCIYLTDGAFAGQASAPRRAESLAVLVRLGVVAGDVHFVGHDIQIPDGALHRNLERALDATRSIVPRADRIARMLVPSWEGGHQDHDAAHLVGLALAGEKPLFERAFQYSLYNGYRRFGSLFRVLSPIPGNGAVVTTRISPFKRWAYLRLCLAYPSQWKSWVGLFPFVCVSYLLRPFQQLQRLRLERVAEPPHAGTLLYERRGFCSWAEFARTTARFREALVRPC